MCAREGREASDDGQWRKQPLLLAAPRGSARLRTHLIEPTAALRWFARGYIRLRRPVAAPVRSEDGAEETELVPANDELAHVGTGRGRRDIAAVAADIRRPPAEHSSKLGQSG